jgi:hypothetical protein
MVRCGSGLLARPTTQLATNAGTGATLSLALSKTTGGDQKLTINLGLRYDPVRHNEEADLATTFNWDLIKSVDDIDRRKPDQGC